MKKTIFSTVAVITLMLGHILNAHATPPEVENCGQKRYSLRYLKNLSKDELIYDHCACIDYVELSEKQIAGNPTLRDVRRANRNARINVTNIARLLKSNHQHPDASKCDIK